MTAPSYNSIIRDGLWNNNPALVQILGLCPLLAVTATVVNGFALGVATAVVLVCSNVTVSLIRGFVKPEVRIPVFVMVIASFVTAIELAMDAYFHALYNILGIFIPLIVTNCNIIARAEAFASRNTVARSMVDGLATGIGFTLVLMALGAMREVIGRGTLLTQANLMFGESAKWMTVTVFDHYNGYLLAILPPGAFLGLGFLIALKNVIDDRLKRRTLAQHAPAARPAGAV